MDSDEGKLFIGGIAWDTTEEKLAEYFNQYGDVSQTVIMRDKTTGRPRGFGFVVYSDPSVLDQVLQDKHTIDGRTVEAKRALSRDDHSSSRLGNFSSGKSSGGGGNIRTKKIFVGGLPSTLTEEGFRQYFENYGIVTDVVIMYDQSTQRPRGFGFISFDSEDAVDNVLHKNFHELNGKLVEVKRALPKDSNPGGGGRGGGYQGYGGSGGNASQLDGRGDGNRYMQPQSAAGGFPPYSGYGGPGYGYGSANSGMGYGGYANYGVGGYGSANAGFGGPAAAYGNPNAPNAGYGNPPPAAMKNTWSGHSPSGYGASGYGANAGYGAVSATMGQSPSGASGYGNQGYGYGNYGGGGGDGPYSGGYGAAGGRVGTALNSNVGAGGEQQGSGGSYMGNNYSDTNGSGYANVAWRADPSQTAGGYGGGYGGGSQARQAQQQ